VLNQLSEGVLLIEPEVSNNTGGGGGGSFGGTFAQISYSNNSLLTILLSKEKKQELIDIDEVLTQMKFKVLFSTNQVRQNLKDYILRIYRSIADGTRLENVNKLTFSVAGLFTSLNDDNSDSEVFKTYIKLSKNKKVLEMTVQKEMSTS